MRRSILAAAACAALAAALAAPAAAHNATFPTTVTIEFVDQAGPDVFQGDVGSTNGNCDQNRLVRLYRSVPGPDQVLDFDRSEDDGSWDVDVEGDPAPGRYYARAVTRQLQPPGGHVHTCATATSAVIPVAG